MPTLSPPAPAVNPTPSTITTYREFSAWCAAQWTLAETTTTLPLSIAPTDDERAIADRLAWSADGGDADDYPGPGWDDDRPAGPSLEDEMYDSGYAIGLEGAYATVFEVFAHFSREAIQLGAMAFTMGRDAGRREHARRAGYDLGVAGDPDDRPASVDRWFAHEFAAGWKAGADEWADRQEIMANWQASVEAAEQQRWLDRENAEASGFYRAWGVAVD